MRAKRLIRKFVPDRVMAKYRLHQHSKQSRVNVDVLVVDKRDARRWLATTPDTYRVRYSDGSVPVDVHTRESFGSDGARALQILGFGETDVGVVANATKPALVSSRRGEPVVDPTGIAMSADVLSEVGGFPSGEKPLRTLLARVRDAGRSILLEPLTVDGPLSGTREDLIDRPVVVILSAVPMHDIGGGSRASQLALEFLDAGTHVVFVALFGAQESVDLGLRFVSQNLEQYRLDQFDVASLIARTGSSGLCIAEIPVREGRGVFAAFAEAGWTTVYDVIDDWSDRALGGEWYDAEVEDWYVATARVVTASAPDLVARTVLGQGTATLVPNAVNVRLFSVEGPVARDLADHDGLVLGYHGSLYGDWFDWQSLHDVAESYPDALVVVIGDDKAERPQMPANVRFLGLMPQGDLPEYVRSFDVGLLPFTVSDTTHAVSPLKVYEYLACGVPVAAPPLRALAGLASVFTDTSLSRAVAAASEGGDVDVSSVRCLHGWRQRVEAIAASSDFELPSTRGVSARVVQRPVVHYDRADRVVGRATGRISES